jgi:hypothetical protein
MGRTRLHAKPLAADAAASIWRRLAHQSYHRPGWLVEFPQIGGTSKETASHALTAGHGMFAFLTRHL